MNRPHWVESASITYESKPWDGQHAMTREDMMLVRISGTITATTSDPTESLRLACGLNADFAEWLDIELKVSTIDDGDGFYTHTYEYPLKPTNN